MATMAAILDLGTEPNLHVATMPPIKFQPFLKGNTILLYCKVKSSLTMNFDTNLIKIGQELRMLWTIEYFNFAGMGDAILNIQ